MMYKWKDDHTTVVLELLKKHAYLWNIRLKDYRNKIRRQNALQEIVRELNLPGVTVEDVTAKIKTIRSRYSSELSKVQLSAKSQDINNIYVPKLIWYKDADSFLRAVCKPRPNVLQKLIHYTSDENRTEDVDVDIKGEDQEDSEEHTSTIASTETVEITEQLEMVNTEEDRNKTVRNRGKKRLFEGGIKHVEVIIEKLQKLSDEYKQSQNEFDFFGKSISVQLKNMPIDRALICQQKIQHVMTEERLSQLLTI